MLCEKWMQRKVFGPKKEEEEKGGDNRLVPASRQPTIAKYYYDDRQVRWAVHVVRVRRRALRK